MGIGDGVPGGGCEQDGRRPTPVWLFSIRRHVGGGRSRLATGQIRSRARHVSYACGGAWRREP